MCPDALQCLEDGIRSQRLGVLERALERFRAAAALTEDADIRSLAMTHEANVLRAQCDWRGALAAARLSRSIAAAAGLATRGAEASIAEANIHLARGELSAALPIFYELLDDVTDPRLRGVVLQNIGNVHAQRGMLGLADAAFAASCTWFERAGYVRGQAIVLNNQGRVRLERADFAAAAALLERALVLARDADDGELIAGTLINLAEALLPTHPARAEELVCTAYGHFRTSGNHLRHLECLRLLGDINEQSGHPEQAAACYRRGLVLAREHGANGEVKSLEMRLRRAASANESGREDRGTTAMA
jgi:tetratricopeptide (TPR) repeat protein